MNLLLNLGIEFAYQKRFVIFTQIYFYTAKVLENIKKIFIGAVAANYIDVRCGAFGICTNIFDN